MSGTSGTQVVAPQPASTGDAGPVLGASGRRRSVGGYLFMPALLLTAIIAVVVAVRTRDLNTLERHRLAFGYVLQKFREHLELTFVSTVLVLLIAIPLGILLTRPFARAITPPAIAVFNIGQAVPSIGLIALFAIIWNIGFWPLVVALVAYTVLPVLRNTMVGLRQVDPSVIESARGMGMTKTSVLLRIELPLAVPIVMAGLRTALTINVGTATLGALVGAGGLGALIVSGIAGLDLFTTVIGASLVAVLALLIDYLASIAEDVLRPRGL